MKLDCHDGSGFHNLKDYNSTGHQTGIPTAETSRQGGSASGMADDQTSLWYKDSSGACQIWAGMRCWEDFATSGTNNWNGQEYATNEYRTVKNTTNSCPGI